MAYTCIPPTNGGVLVKGVRYWRNGIVTETCLQRVEIEIKTKDSIFEMNTECIRVRSMFLPSPGKKSADAHDCIYKTPFPLKNLPQNVLFIVNFEGKKAKF